VVTVITPYVDFNEPKIFGVGASGNVRCVYGSQLNLDQYAEIGDGTVTEETTNLE